MPVAGEIWERARAAAQRVDELSDLAARRELWAREIERLEPDVAKAREETAEAVGQAERAMSEARSSRGFLGALKDRLAGNLPEGRDDRLAQKTAIEATAGARRLASEALLRRLEGELEDARKKLLHADGARGSLAAARQTERKIYIQMAGLTGDGDLESFIAELTGQERRCEAWRSAHRAAVSRRDHTEAGFHSLCAFRDAWPSLSDSLGDVIHGSAGACPPEALEHLKRARHELYLGARAGVAALGQGVLADLVGIAAHEIDRAASIAKVAALLTRAIDELGPVAATAAKTLADLEKSLAASEDSCEVLRARIHARLFGLPGQTMAR